MPEPSHRYAELTWPQVAEWSTHDPVCVIPVATLEDHGYHLPIDTDVVIAETLAEQAVLRCAGRSLLLPTVTHGYTPHHMDFPGPITIDWKTFVDDLCDIGRSLHRHGFGRILFVNGHGSNVPLVDMAARLLMVERPETIAASFWYLSGPESAELLRRTRDSDAPGGMAHACELETSLYLAIKPDLVQMDRAVREIPDWGSRERVDGLERRPALDQGRLERLDRVGRRGRCDGRDGREGPAVARPGRGRGGGVHRRAGRARAAPGPGSSRTGGGPQMNARRLIAMTMLAAAVATAAGCGGGGAAGGGGGGGSTKGGILRVGTINYIDSLNPFVALESQSYNAFVMIYPQLVQYGPNEKLEGDWATSWSHSADGLTWTFHVKPAASGRTASRSRPPTPRGRAT